MTFSEKATSILDFAKDLAGRTRSRTEFSNAIFDQRDGVIAKTFPKLSERNEFRATEEYDAVRSMLLDLTRRYGRLGEEAPEKSGKFVVRIPKTLHTILEVEAKSESVSLNQLATAKLARSLTGKHVQKALIAEAFRQVHDGYSSDRVVVDDELDAKFLERCRDLGLDEQSDFFLNWMLLDFRKSTKGMLPKTTKVTKFPDYDCFEFAAELAVRALQRSSGVSLDQVLCDPELRRKFDEIAVKLSAEKLALKLRCAALNLRKTHRLKPGDLHARDYELMSAGLVTSLDPLAVPIKPGAYVFYGGPRPIFAGESVNLRNRIATHLAVSNGRGLPEWLDGLGDTLELRYFADEKAKQDIRVGWLNDFINRERPVLNYQKAA